MCWHPQTPLFSFGFESIFVLKLGTEWKEVEVGGVSSTDIKTCLCLTSNIELQQPHLMFVIMSQVPERDWQLELDDCEER